MTAPGKWGRINATGRRRVAGSMNKTEAAYARLLEARRVAGEVAWWAFEPLSLRLAKGSSYSPDFVHVESDGLIVCTETKGTAGWSLDSESRTKWKACGERYPLFAFRAATARRKADGGGWDHEEYQPHQGMGGGA